MVRKRRCPIRVRRLACAALSCAAGLAALPSQAQSEREAGDFLATAMPLATLGIELVRGEREGAWQYTLSFTVSVVATEALKRVTHVERPDGSNDQSFPSGHAVRAFSSATYVHRRYGFDAAWPLYLAATYVGYTRVAAQRHTWADVAGAAAVSAASTWWLVEPKQQTAVVALPEFGRGRIGIQLHAQW